MKPLSTAAGPGMRRVLDALGKLASEWASEKRRPARDLAGQNLAGQDLAQQDLAGQDLAADWRSSLIAGQKNVIQHYRRVLATQRMPPAERQAVLDRIKRLEEEIRALEAGQIDRQLEAA